MGQRRVGEQPRRVKHMQLVHTVGQHLLFYSFQSCSCCDGFQLATQLVGQFAAFGEQFQTDIGNCRTFYFEIYKYVVHNCL